MISPLIYYSYNILINHNNLSLFIYFSNQVALVKATQKDHAPSGQVHTKIVMVLDTNPTHTTFHIYPYFPQELL